MADEFFCDTREVRSFINDVKRIIAEPAPVEERLAAIRPLFSRLMSDPDWLPGKFRRTIEAGGMGRGAANWLLYRDTGGALSFCSLVLSPGAATPVHDHLAWGLVGLYAGRQVEEVYEPAAPVRLEDSHADLSLVKMNTLEPGSFYELIPPTGDVHRVVTIGDEPSISLHLLANDIGCVWRHTFVPETGQVVPFRSGYANKECDAERRAG
ncbi:MAG: hypothetical protein ACM3NF_07395 [Gemmatimonadota bacterium]